MEGGRQLGFEFVARNRTSITVRVLGDEVIINLLSWVMPCSRHRMGSHSHGRALSVQSVGDATGVGFVAGSLHPDGQ